MAIIRNLACISLLAVILYHCSHSRNKPQLNPHPNYFLTIQGHIDRQLQNNVYLAFAQSYSAYNKACEITTNWFEGIKGYPSHSITYYPQIAPNGNYKIVIPLDHYLPDKCQWQPWDLSFSLSNAKNKRRDPEGFVDYGQQKGPIPKFYNIVCTHSAYDCQRDIPEHTYMTFTVDRKKSQTIHFNLVHRKKS